MNATYSIASRGFSLVEALCTIAAIAILAAVGAPSLGRMMRVQEAQSQGYALASAMRFARSEAISRGGRVTLCQRDANGSKGSCASSAGPWSTGWIVFVDGGSLGEVDAGDAVLRVFPAPPQTVQVLPSVDSKRFASLTWDPTGVLLGRSTTGARVLVRSSVESEYTLGRWVCISAIGRVRVAGNADACAGDDGSG